MLSLYSSSRSLQPWVNRRCVFFSFFNFSIDSRTLTFQRKVIWKAPFSLRNLLANSPFSPTQYNCWWYLCVTQKQKPREKSVSITFGRLPVIKLFSELYLWKHAKTAKNNPLVQRVRPGAWLLDVNPPRGWSLHVVSPQVVEQQHIEKKQQHIEKQLVLLETSDLHWMCMC